MSIVVEHDERRHNILSKALDVFMDEGFEDVTFQKIADRCGITRTTLYIYFKNKKDIFNFSIKQLLQDVENDILLAKKVKNISHTEKLIRVMTVIIERLEENRRLLSVVLNYLFFIAKSDYDPDKRVRRRTVKLRHILATMINDGVKDGEFFPVNVKDADELLYSFVESAVFRLAILRREYVAEIKDAIKLAITRFRA
ncbi:MAG: TetR/AcrR family transcriptional regulator [Treponema sp.]|jgi:AcrR family transcriptional regulator|nr:TetR/AcrR family transcriptional regulator [Treponema sp.]